MQKNLRFYREPDHLRSICSLVIFPALRMVSTSQKYFLYCTTDIRVRQSDRIVHTVSMVGVTLPATPSFRSQKSIGFSMLNGGATDASALKIKHRYASVWFWLKRLLYAEWEGLIYYNNGVIYKGRYVIPSLISKSLVWRTMLCANCSAYFFPNFSNEESVYRVVDFTSIG